MNLKIVKKTVYKKHLIIVTQISMPQVMAIIKGYKNETWPYCNGYVQVRTQEKDIIESHNFPEEPTFKGTGEHIDQPETYFVGFDTAHYNDTKQSKKPGVVLRRCKKIVDYFITYTEDYRNHVHKPQEH